MEGTFLDALKLTTGIVPAVLVVGDTTYLELPTDAGELAPPYVRLTKTAGGWTLAVSSAAHILTTTDVAGEGQHPDGVATKIAGLVHRAGHGCAARTPRSPFTCLHLTGTEWPPGRMTSFALMLALQTHAASDVPFTRTALTANSSAWARADRQRMISTVYKDDHLELSDTHHPSVTQVCLYPSSLKWRQSTGWQQREGWEVGAVLRELWQRLARCDSK